MDSFIGKYFELGISGPDLEICNDNEITLHDSGKWHITAKFKSNAQWTITIKLEIDLPYYVRLDIARYVNKHMFVEPGELKVTYTRDEFITLITCITDPKQLQHELAELIPGYIPFNPTDCFIMTWKREQRGSYTFVMNVLLKECFSSVWNDRFKDTLKPLPGFIQGINKYQFEQIGAGLNIIRELDMTDKSDAECESEIYKQSWLAYEVIRCALVNFNVYSLESLDSTGIIGKSSAHIYKVKYNNPAVCDKFDKLMTSSGHMAYHGSSVMNWYSIVYNGLFVAKGAQVVNGASYGTGIYMSDSSTLSMDYSKLHIHDNNIILGVFQVAESIDKFKKATNTYVVPDEKKVCLRYLIYMKASTGASVCENMDKYFINGEMVRETEKEVAVVNNTWSRRIMGELRELHARDGILCDDGLRYLVNDSDNMSIIVLSLCRETFIDSLLGKDMDNMHIDYIKMEIRLPDAYPFEPPFIRVLSPKFAFRKGHITVGGSVCMDLLTKQRWVPSMSISKIMITIVQNIIAGDGRLEPGGKNYVYSLQEAQSAFTRMLVTHSGEW